MNLASYNLTVEDLASKLMYSEQHIRTLAAEGKLPALKRFRRWFFNEQEVYEALKKQSSVADDKNGANRRTKNISEADSEILR